MFKCHTVFILRYFAIFFSLWLFRRNIYIKASCAGQCIAWNADKNPWCFSFQTQHLPFWIQKRELYLSTEVCAVVLCHIKDSTEACNHCASLWTVLLALYLHLLRYGDCGLVLPQQPQIAPASGVSGGIFAFKYYRDVPSPCFEIQSILLIIHI